MADLLRNGDAEDVAVKLGAFEQQALIHDFSTSASARFNATLNSLSKWLVAAVFGIIFLWRHDTEALWAASGSILNAGLSTVLKRILNQERPVSAIRSDPGMPSTHAQSIFYTVMFCIVSMVEYFGLNGVTAVISALIFAIGSYLGGAQPLGQASLVSIMVSTFISTVMATGFTTTPHDQSSIRRCCTGILFLRFLVLVVGRNSP
ncbi:hypothetical protein KY290_016310 [Solanum tuberosum]|uniref:Phosphatidic acid phosphatase type 2/haloperoxidase domain-containing protein n=1 Tax=Solanum tuberosum TaxID=4113 RepID=A0ABQ7VV53_SOLTU|nr:hypothetical protein KY289_013902 [Solanum tuberosum]KAH0772329.1 hypothetical protein KY290_016310 [Solanum tuberosum]